FGHYDIEKDLRFNFGAIYSDSTTQVQLAPTPATGIVITYNPTMQAWMQINHPDLAAALASRTQPGADFVMDRRTNELRTRGGTNENSSASLFASLEGSISDSWNYELSASYADIDFVSRLEHSANKTALAQGLAGCHGARQPGVDGILGTA